MEEQHVIDVNPEAVVVDQVIHHRALERKEIVVYHRGWSLSCFRHCRFCFLPAGGCVVGVLVLLLFQLLLVLFAMDDSHCVWGHFVG